MIKGSKTHVNKKVPPWDELLMRNQNRVPDL